MTERQRRRKVSMFAGQRLYVDAYEWSDGSVSIEGQHFRGEDEYEYFFTIDVAFVHLLRAALAGDDTDDVLDLLKGQGESLVRRGEMHWLQDQNIPYTFDSYR